MRSRDLKILIKKRAEECNVTFRLKREGANHSVFTLGNSTIIIARHRELKEGDMRATLNQTESELGAKWWK
jgi:hypothetical protein